MPWPCLFLKSQSQKTEMHDFKANVYEERETLIASSALLFLSEKESIVYLFDKFLTSFAVSSLEKTRTSSMEP